MDIRNPVGRTADPTVKPRDTSIMDALLLRGETDHRKINMPRSNEYIINNRNQYLHVRSVWPKSISNPSDVKGLVLCLHGYGSQANRPTHRYFSERMNAENMAYFTIDFAGHGYSEGHRGQVLSVDDIIDDALHLVLALFGAPSVVCNLEHRFSPLWASMNDKNFNGPIPPIYVMGHSMGGGTAIVVSYLLSYKDSTNPPKISTPFYLFHQEYIQKYITPHFFGGVFVCPVVRLTSLSSWLREATLGILADIFPFTIIPLHWGDDDDDKHPSWASAAYRRYTHEDGYPHNPQGLTYADSISFRTMHSILILSDYVQAILSEIKFPFMLLHDPADTIVPYEGSLLMMQKTVQVASSMKKLLVTPNMLHDILANDAIHCADEIIQFIHSISDRR